MDDLLIGYALNALSPADRAAVEAHLAAHPEDAAKVDRVRALLAPLAADRDDPPLPAGLVVATVARTAEYLVAHRLVPFAQPEPPAETARPSTTRQVRPIDEPVYPAWRRFDVAVAAAIAFVAVGLGLAGIGKLRADANQIACQEKLREVHVALDGYSETHGGRYPQVGTPAVPNAGAFATELVRAGHLSSTTPVCPAVVATEPRPLAQVGFAYTLGYVDPVGQYRGPCRGDGDWTPILADVPGIQLAGAAEPTLPHARGQNVLFIGGTVRFAKTPSVGVNGDHIYCNDAGLVRAGLHPLDTSLGRWSDVP
jgi:hypothetical protein